jgi:AcrR family transcriptional regulator
MLISSANRLKGSKCRGSSFSSPEGGRDYGEEPVGIKERKERERQQRILQIKDAARDVFSVKPYALASMEDIAARAELGPATIYQYFKGKKELYGSLSLEPLSRLVAETERACKDKKASLSERLARCSKALYSTYRNDPLALRILHDFMHPDASADLRDSFLLKEQNNLVRRAISAVSKLFEEGIEQGKFRDGDCRVYAHLLYSTVTGIIIWEESKRRSDPKKDYLRQTINLFLEIFTQGISR